MITTVVLFLLFSTSKPTVGHPIVGRPTYAPSGTLSLSAIH